MFGKMNRFCQRGVGNARQNGNSSRSGFARAFNHFVANLVGQRRPFTRCPQHKQTIHATADQMVHNAIHGFQIQLIRFDQRSDNGRNDTGKTRHRTRPDRGLSANTHTSPQSTPPMRRRLREKQDFVVDAEQRQQ